MDVVGFDISTTIAAQSYGLGLNNGNNGTPQKAIANRVHDLASAANASNCVANYGGPGGGGIFVSSGSPSGQSIIGNVIFNIGNTGTCHFIHGMYLHGQKTTIENNIVYQISCFAINAGQPGNTITNNTIFNSGGGGTGCGGILVGNNANMTINNNILYNNCDGGGCPIYAISGLNGALVANNLWKADTGATGSGPVSTCLINGSLTNTTVTGTINAEPNFVNYKPDGTGDYHLAPGSPGIDAGTTSCSGATATPCTPGYDFDSRSRSVPPSLSAYEM